MKKFLTARWQDLIMINYEIDPLLLGTRVPPGVDLDLEGGKCFVSLVAFMFLDTRVLGIPIPFHINFEEVNLRFYVKREVAAESRRGVCFIKEIVPRWAIATVARVLYGEPYESRKMENRRTGTHVEYGWGHQGVTDRVAVERSNSLGVPTDGSHESFIIEHYWGYTDRGHGRIDEYRVDHPKWELFSVEKPMIAVDFQANYGSDFAFLAGAEPYSILLAKGSEVAVYKGKNINL